MARAIVRDRLLLLTIKMDLPEPGNIIAGEFSCALGKGGRTAKSEQLLQLGFEVSPSVDQEVVTLIYDVDKPETVLRGQGRQPERSISFAFDHRQRGIGLG